MNLENLQEFMRLAGVPRSSRKKVLDKLKEDRSMPMTGVHRMDDVNGMNGNGNGMNADMNADMNGEPEADMAPEGGIEAAKEYIKSAIEALENGGSDSMEDLSQLVDRLKALLNGDKGMDDEYNGDEYGEERPAGRPGEERPAGRPEVSMDMSMEAVDSEDQAADALSGNTDSPGDAGHNPGGKLKGKQKSDKDASFKSPFKKGQIVQWKGMKYRVEVPNAKADFVGIVPLKGGEVDLVRSNNLKALKESTTLNEVKGHHVLFTGFRDKELARLVDEKGGSTQSNWNKKTSLVVAKDPNSQSGKAKKARAAGISVISREQLKDRLLGLKEAEDYSSAARMPVIDPGERTVRTGIKPRVRGAGAPLGTTGTVRTGHVVDELLDAIAKAIPFIGYTASVEEVQERLEKAFEGVAGVPWTEWRKNPRGAVREAGYASDDVKDKNKQVKSTDLGKTGKKAEKTLDQKVTPNTLADTSGNKEDKLSSDDMAVTIKVPSEIKSSLKEKIDELRKEAKLVGTRDGALADFYDRTANFFEGILERLKTGDENDVKMAIIETQRVVNTMRYQLPQEVWDFFARGGRTRTLSDHFKQVKMQK